MDRRRFLLTSLAGSLAVPLSIEAEQAGKVWRIGVLTVAPLESAMPLLRHFDEGLRELGYVEGRNIILERRSAGGRLDKLPKLAAELVRLRVDLIVAAINPQISAAKRATTTIPIVMVHAVDPVEAGYVASLARPGGTITGLTIEASNEIEGKRLEILKEIVPRLSRVAILRQVGGGSAESFAAIETAARVLGVTLQVVDIRVLEDFENAFKGVMSGHPDALSVYGGSLTWMRRQQIADFAIKNRLPTIHGLREYAEAGFLASYGLNLPAVYRRAATYVDKILRGAKPGDLPVEQPTTFELVINLETAKALDLTIPPSLLARADQVIE
jgi:putative tryptophan/tyrosine transport system substrate-binding protein